MILFKSCPRCGGDVDATHADDVYCVQCSHRPEVAYPGPRIVQKPAKASESTVGADHTGGSPGTAGRCPKCGSTELVSLDRLREEDNSCYRCRSCGHVFSPATGREVGRRQTTP